MNTQSIKNLTILSFIFISSLTYTSCDSDNNDTNISAQPQLIQDYYFRGTLDGEAFNLEKKVYDFYSDAIPQTPYSIDFGGSETDDDIDDSNEVCRSSYACGIVQYQNNDFDEAKMYFANIPVGDCNLETELEAMISFLELNDYTYDKFFDFNDVLNNTVALDFFPANTPQNGEYFSSRFGNNTDATFQITSIIEESTGIYIVEGLFNCKLYSFENSGPDNTVFKLFENGEFKIKIRNNLE